MIPFASVQQGTSLPEGYISPLSAPQKDFTQTMKKKKRGRPKKKIVVDLINQQEAVTIQRKQ